MKLFNEFIESMKSGFAHSHASDYLSGTDKLKAITDYNASTHAKQNLIAQSNQEAARKEMKRKSVAMFLGSELPKSLMNYMIETCQSQDNDLMILSFESNTVTEALIKPYEKDLEENDIKLKKVRLSGNPMEELNRYLKGHPEVAFLACKETGFLGRIYLSGNPAKFKLPIPVVVVTADQSASMNTDNNDENGTKINVA